MLNEIGACEFQFIFFPFLGAHPFNYTGVSVLSAPIAGGERQYRIEYETHRNPTTSVPVIMALRLSAMYYNPTPCRIVLFGLLIVSGCSICTRHVWTLFGYSETLI